MIILQQPNLIFRTILQSINKHPLQPLRDSVVILRHCALYKLTYLLTYIHSSRGVARPPRVPVTLSGRSGAPQIQWDPRHLTQQPPHRYATALLSRLITWYHIYCSAPVVTACVQGTWGVSCREHCRCTSQSSCDPITGICNCNPGWSGESCDTRE